MINREPLPADNRDAEPASAGVPINVRSVALTVIAAAAAMYILQWASEVFIPIVLSVLVSYALEPLVLGLGKVKVPRAAAAASGSSASTADASSESAYPV